MEKQQKINWQQACKILGCGKTCFYSLIHRGILPAYRRKDCKKGWWVYEKDCIEVMEKNIKTACEVLTGGAIIPILKVWGGTSRV